MNSDFNIKVRVGFLCRAGCQQPAREGQACCSQKCRDLVPNCSKEGCNNAVEMGWSHGTTTPGSLCYNCGGRFHFDGEPQEDIVPRQYPLVLTTEGWKVADTSK